MRLAIVKDIVEWKLFLAYYESLSEEQRKRLELCTPLDVDWSVFNRSTFCLAMPSLLTRIIYFICIQAWMFERRKHSHTACQILLYNIFVLPFSVYRNSRRNTFLFSVLKLFYRGLSAIDDSVALKPKFRLENLIKSRIVKEARSIPSLYTEILSFRYYSADVGLLVSSLCKANPNINVTAFCRSDDTPDTKGPPTFEFDRIVFSNSFQFDRFKALSLSDQVVDVETTLFSIAKDSVEKLDRKPNKRPSVLYAASDEFWNPTELEVVAQLLQMFDKKLELTVRPMINDTRDWKAVGCGIDSSSYQLPLNLDSIKDFYIGLMAYDLIISMTSTIVNEADEIGIKSGFVVEENMGWVFDREHLKGIIERGIPCVSTSRVSDLLFSNEGGMV